MTDGPGCAEHGQKKRLSLYTGGSRNLLYLFVLLFIFAGIPASLDSNRPSVTYNP